MQRIGVARRLSPSVAIFASLLCLWSPAHANDCKPVADSSRISVAGGSITEILFELGVSERIVGVDRTSNYPAEARELPQLGYVRNLSAEGMLSLAPTLVLGEHDMGPPDVLEQLSRVGVPIVAVPERFDRSGIVAKVRCVGDVVAEADRARAIINALPQAPVPSGAPERGLVILNMEEGAPIAAGADTSGHGFLALAGVENVMDFEGWKPVSAEALAAAKPDIIVITERGLKSAGGIDRLLAPPALASTPAAGSRAVLSLDGMAMLGFGLRTVTAAQELRTYLDEMNSAMQVPVSHDANGRD